MVFMLLGFIPGNQRSSENPWWEIKRKKGKINPKISSYHLTS
jgi:hypothetical protein